MSENKVCNRCNKFTADEIVKGDIFCIECGHQRDKVGTSHHQKVKKEYWKRWWYIAIWLVIVYFLFPYVKQVVNSNSKIRMMEKYSTDKINLNKNLNKLSSEDSVDLNKLTLKSYEAIMKNLNAQDSYEFARLAKLGEKLTYDESLRMTELVNKASNAMPPEERKVVEQFYQQGRSLLR